MKLTIFICTAILALFSFMAIAQQNTTQPDQSSNTSTQSSDQDKPDQQATEPDNTKPAQPTYTQPDTSTPSTTQSTPDQTTTEPESKTESNTRPTPTQVNTGAAGSAGTESTPPASDAPKLEVSKRGQTVATLHGRGDSQTRTFNLHAGPATFDVQLNWERSDPSLRGDQGNFSVTLADSNHKTVDTVIATIDYFDGANTINVPADGTYMLHIKAPGTWSVRIEQ